MQNSYRWFISVTAAALCALIPASVTIRANDPPHWRVGDVFVGVGSEMSPNGTYVVYDEDGEFKETLTNKVGQFVMTTGCAIAPPIAGLDEALYGTNFFGASWSDPLVFPEANFGPSVTRLSAAHPHAATLAPYQIPRPDVIATESIVFDADGYAYLGGIVGPFDGSTYPNGYIFKFNPAGGYVETYEVPNENKGADWIDLDVDPVTGERTIYYTSEGQHIHWYKPATGTSGAFAIRERGATEPNSTVAYAFRLLPRRADNLPSGFLVATSDSVLRLTPDGEIVKRYNAFRGATAPGTFFALNISPDGQTFWTAIEQPDTEVFVKGTKEQTDPVTGYPISVAPARAWIYKFHIGTGELMAGPIDTKLAAPTAFSVKGLCIKREYTAALNQCVKTDIDGNPILDANGHEQFERCQARELCSGNFPGDDDGDSLEDARDPDCAIPGSPRFAVTIDPTENYNGDYVAGYPAVTGALAVSPRNLPLTYSVSGQPTGIDFDLQTGIMSGTIATSVPLPHTFNVTVTATDGTLSASTTFSWLVLKRDINLPPTLSPALPWSSTHPQTPFTVSAFRQQAFALPSSDPEGASLWVIASHSSDGGVTFAPGLPSGYAFTNVFPDTLENRSPWIPVSSEYGVAGLKQSWQGQAVNILGTQPVQGQYIVRVAITEDFEKVGCAPAPSCNPRPERDWSTAFQQFTITVVNDPPQFVVAPQTSIVGRPATPYTVVATDADGHTLTYALAPGSELPPGITLTGNTFSGTPTQEGIYNVSFKVTDEAGASTTKTFVWTVKLNNPPQCGGARPTQVLWPPNHQMVEIGITGVTDEDPFDTVAITVTDILQDEPVQVIGSGATNQFDGIKGGPTAWVRAERTGVPGIPGDGRVYQIFFQATDGKETCTGSVTVGIPHDWRQPRMPVASGSWWDSVTRLPR